VTSRTARFALGGAAVVATAALLFERTLPITERVYRRRGTPWIHEPPRAYVLGFELSPTEAVIWFIVLGAIAGAVLGAVFALLRQRRDTFMLVGAILGGVLGLGYNASLDEVCIGGGDVFACGYSSFFGWEIAPLAAWGLWTAIGAAMGTILGLFATRVSWRT
jgi:hypothetical protein